MASPYAPTTFKYNNMPTTYSKNVLVEVQRKYKQLLSSPRDSSTRKQLRDLREIVRRESALERKRDQWKSLSKSRRDSLITLQRAIKAHHYLYDDDDCEMAHSQGGIETAAAVIGAASAATVAISAAKGAMSVSRALSAVGNTMTEASSSVDSIMASLRSFVESAKNTFGMFWLMPVAIGIYAIWSCIAAVPLIMGVVLRFAASVLGEVWQWVRGFFTGVKSQSGAIDTASYFATVASVLLVPKKNPAIMVGEISKRIGSFDRVQTGLVSMFEKGLKYVEKAVNVVLALFTETRVDWTDSTDKLVEAWAKKVDAFEVACIRGNPELSELRKAVVLLQEGVGFRQMLKTVPTLAYVNKYTDRLSALLQAHKGALNAASSFRMAPLSVMLGGGSGVGKTSVVKWVAAAFMLLAGIAEPDEVLNNMWQKGISEYWNGYVQQKVYIMDDCFQQKTDGKQLDNEAMFMIRAVGNWAFPLNFADLDSKGRFYFMSDAIMGTTNVDNIHQHVSGMVAEPAAVTRRIEHGYWVYVNPDYCVPGTKRLDYAKVASEIRANRARLGETIYATELLECIPWRAWNIVPHSFDKAHPENIHNDVTLLDLAKQMAAQYAQRSASHDEEVADLVAWSKDLAKAIRCQSGIPDAAGFAYVRNKVRKWDAASAAPSVTTTVKSFSLAENPSAAQDMAEACMLDEIWQTEENSASEYNNWVIERAKRIDWIGSALMGLEDWFASRNFPPALSWIFSYLDCRGFCTEEQGEDVINSRMVFFAHNPVLATVLSNFMRFGYLLILIKVMSFVVNIAIGLFKGLVDVVTGLLPGFGRVETQSNVPQNIPSRSDMKMPSIKSQLGNPPEDHHSNIVYNNTYKMLVIDGDVVHNLGQIIFVEGDLALMPYHFIDSLRTRPSASLHFVCVASPAFSVRMPVKTFMGLQFARMQESDAVFVRFERKMLKAHRSIVNQFFSETALKQFLRNKANHVRLDVARKGAKPEDIVRTTMVSGLCEYNTSPLVTDKGKFSFTVAYNMPTMDGDCGAPLTVCEPRFWGGSCLIGLHIAGKAGLCVRKGYASIVTRENVHDARSTLSTWADNFTEELVRKGVGVEELSYEEIVSLQSAGIIAGSHVPICKVDKGLSIGGNSKIKVSPVQLDEVFGPCPTRPSHLHAVRIGDEVHHPMAKAMEAYQSPLEFDRSKGLVYLPNAVEVALRPHWDVTKNYDTSILTFEEAVNPPACYRMKPLNRSTSAGYPYRLDGSVGKKDFFGDTGDFEFDSDACKTLREDVDIMIASAKRGERLSVIFTDFPKDEVRPHAKVDAVATRAISGAPLNYVIAVRMYFGAFIAASFATHTENGMAPGVNPYTDWHVLATKLTSKGDKIFAGDFSRFDASEQPEIHELILDYINRWYRRNGGSDEDDKVRSVLWLDLIHSRHLTGKGGKLDVIVQWAKSLPSGHPLTTLVNSMYALITLTACYIYLTKDHRDMWTKVQLITYGDDNVNSISDDVAEVFNQVTVAAAMKELFGLTYTSDKKGQELVEHETINDVTFLKRSFVEDPTASGGWAAPLDVASFLFIPYWFKNPRDPEGDLESNIELMLSELCLYDDATWDKYYAPLAAWCDSHDISMRFLSRDLARSWTFARADVWH